MKRRQRVCNKEPVYQVYIPFLQDEKRPCQTGQNSIYTVYIPLLQEELKKDRLIS